jgi:hypothetical protein
MSQLLFYLWILLAIAPVVGLWYRARRHRADRKWMQAHRVRRPRKEGRQ